MPEDYIITLYFEDVECSYGYSSPQDKDNDSYGLVFYDTRGRLGYRSARLRGQSCYDMVYQVMGAWTADLY